MNYYNEFDSYAAEYLRNLIAAGAIPAGHVDERSIVDVTPGDLAGYVQCHFFAGIGGWPLALRMAGVSDSTRLWTGSCPCQPFSVAGKGKGAKDERHLWPVWFKLIEAQRPECLLGEQVASPAARDWFDGVCSDLESIGYTCGAVIVGAHSAGADHQRQRLYWMAYAETVGRRQERKNRTGCNDRDTPEGRAAGSGLRGAHGSMVQPIGTGLEGHTGYGDGSHEPGRVGTDSTGSTAATGNAGGMADSGCECDERRGDAGQLAREGSEVEAETREWERRGDAAGDCRADSGLGDAGSPGDGRGQKSTRGAYRPITDRPGAWDDSYWLACSDGKLRRVPAEPSLFPLADGVSRQDMEQVRAILAGMGLSPEGIKRALRKPRSLVALAGRHRAGVLKGSGNAIVPQVAAEFITAAFEAIDL